MPQDKMHKAPRRDKDNQGYLGRQGFDSKAIKRGYKKLGSSKKK